MRRSSRERAERPTIISVRGLWITVVSRQSRTHLRDFIKLLTPGQALIRPTHTFALYLTALGKRHRKCVCWMSKFVRPKCVHPVAHWWWHTHTHTHTWFTVVRTASVWNMSVQNNLPQILPIIYLSPLLRITVLLGAQDIIYSGETMRWETKWD